MTPHVSLSTNHTPGLYDERRPRGLRRSFTRLPVTTRIPKDQVEDVSIGHQPTPPVPRHTPKNGIALSRTTTNSRLPSKNAPLLPSVVQAKQPSDLPSNQNNSSRARPPGGHLRLPPPSTRTPSLVSGSTISNQDSLQSTLRRKASTINQYAQQAKTDPESMQRHQDLVDTMHKAQYDDPFPGAILGMTFPITTSIKAPDAPSQVSAAHGRRSNIADNVNISNPSTDLQAPLFDAASSRHTDSPFSHQSTQTSASSHSSVAASSAGPALSQGMLDTARSVKRTRSRKTRDTVSSHGFSLPEELSQPHTSESAEATLDFFAKQTRRVLPRTAGSFPKPAKAQHNHKSIPEHNHHRVEPVHIPPELAHLNVDVTSQQNDKSFPPRRPSRDGIAVLNLPLDIPVVQSNLVPNDLPKSESSRDTSELAPDSENRKSSFGFSHRSPPCQSLMFRPRSIRPATPKSPSECSAMGSPLSRQDSPMVLSSPNTLKSPRANMLSKRDMHSPKPHDKPDKPKKGPAAGTGHEGYGKFGFRGRGSSIFGGRSSRSPSNDSNTSRKGFSFLNGKKSIPDGVENGVDNFLHQRREPLIIRGGGNVANTEARDSLSSKLADPVEPQSTRAQSREYELPPKLTDTFAHTVHMDQPSLSTVVDESKNDQWPSAGKSSAFMQRMKTRIPTQGLGNRTEQSRKPQAHQQRKLSERKVADQNKNDRSECAKASSRPPQRSQSSDHSKGNCEKLIPYDQRHEGLMPAPPPLQSKTKSFESPVLLKAKTAIPAKASPPVNISKHQEERQQAGLKARLRSIGRIPQVVRAGHDVEIGPLDKPSDLPLIHGGQDLPIGQIFVESEEFIAFPSRKNSELSYTSSSGLGSPYITRTSFVGEDEVWNEHDTLIDEVMPVKMRASATSSLGAPFQYGDMVEHKVTAHTKEQLTPRSASNPETGKDSNLDTSRPSTTFTISDYLVDQESTKEQGLQHTVASSSGDRTTDDQSNCPSRIQSGESSCVPVKNERVDNSTSVELRFAALMTSKWLSFGRLLFSPAHEEASSGNHTRILILDGLGKDWSYNCALTYPRCQFYNLGPEPFSSCRETLSNYHHIPHSSISTPFPFPNNYFAAVVFRFPIAAADDAYQACFHEMKRTLRPSGYLEISVLDLDLMNMGSTARKTIRDLKIRIHQSDSQISLWNHGDAFLTLLGRHDFANIQRCHVGIPVAGRIRRSQDSSSSSGGNELHRQKKQSEQEPEYFKFTEWMQRKDRHEDEEDENHARRNDEDITKTVAKIGRWWYSSCYPDPGMDRHNTNLWDTPGLLRECERQRTSFRLLFCYAQKPVCVKRRTASV